MTSGEWDEVAGGHRGTWSETWSDRDGSPGWTLSVEGDVEDGELYAEVSGFGPFRWKVGESWEGGRVLGKGKSEKFEAAKRAAEFAIDPDAYLIEMPGTLAEFVQDFEFDEWYQDALDAAQYVGRGRGFVLRIVAPLEVHRYLLGRCWALEGIGTETTQGERRAYRAYKQRIAACEQKNPEEAKS